MKRVSKEKEYSRATPSYKFHDSISINNEIKNGSWRALYNDLKDICGDMTVGEFFDALSDFYELRDEVAAVLQFRNTVTKRPLDEDDQLCDFDIKELEVRCYYPAGHKVEVDISCDSSFMLSIMHQVGQALREKFHWVDKNEKIYLVMDNAGGHGTQLAKEEYRRKLESEYNVEIVWQVPRSPETNMLDLGVWMSIQNKVEKVHHGKRPDCDALARSIEEAWEHHLSPQAFLNVWKRLRRVLKLIVDDKGGNNLVESERGKLFRDPTIDDLLNAHNDTNNEDQENNSENENDEASDEENDNELQSNEWFEELYLILLRSAFHGFLRAFT
jgi:hypothetical protein